MSVASSTSRLLPLTLLFACNSEPLDSCLNWDEEVPKALPSSDAEGCIPPRLFGHRGTWKVYAPENTLAAFACAVEQGADGVEIDLRITADGVIVAMHDSTPNRTTDATDAPKISEMTLGELRELDAGSWFDAAFTGTKVPTLDETLDLLEPTSAYLLFDLKGADAVPTLVATLNARGLRARSIISANQRATLEIIYALDPTIELLYYAASLDVLPTLDIPSLRYIRVPKNVVGDPESVSTIRAAGYEAVVGEYRVDYNYAFGLADNLPTTWERVWSKVPEHCFAPTQ